MTEENYIIKKKVEWLVVVAFLFISSLAFLLAAGSVLIWLFLDEALLRADTFGLFSIVTLSLGLFMFFLRLVHFISTCDLTLREERKISVRIEEGRVII